ncbi:MAG: tetratricopeptide repeat protein [Candidatus Desantisbacteria bacterium]
MRKIIFIGLILLICQPVCFAQQPQQKQDNQYKDNFLADYLFQKGSSCYQMKNYKEAIACFNEVYQTNSKNEQVKKALASSYFQLATEAYKQDNLTQAKEYFLSSLNYSPLFETYQNLTMVLIKLKEYDRAEEIARQGLKLKPDSRELLSILAECYHQKKDQGKLLEIFQRLYKYCPDNLEIALNLGSLYRMNRQAHDAMELYKKIKIQFPKEKRIYERIAEIQSSGYKYKEARETYQELLKYYPNDTEILTKIAKFYVSESKYEEARNTYKAVLKIRVGDLETYRGIANTYEKQKDIDSALSVFVEARGKNSDNLIILKELGRLYEEKGSLTQAEITYKEMINIRGDEPYAYIKLGLLSEKESHASATTYFNKACDLKATAPLPYYKLALWFGEKAGTESLYYTKFAIEKALRQTEEIRGSLFVRFNGLGGGEMDFGQLGELSEAAKELEEPQKILEESLNLLIKLRGEDKNKLLADLKDFLDDHKYIEALLCEIALIYQDKKDYKTALIFWEKAVKAADKGKKDTYLNMAVCQENLGNEIEVANLYRRVIELDKECNFAYEGLIRIYKKNNKLPELITQWEKMTGVIDNPMMVKYLEVIKK